MGATLSRLMITNINLTQGRVDNCCGSIDTECLDQPWALQRKASVECPMAELVRECQYCPTDTVIRVVHCKSIGLPSTSVFLSVAVFNSSGQGQTDFRAEAAAFVRRLKETKDSPDKPDCDEADCPFLTVYDTVSGGPSLTLNGITIDLDYPVTQTPLHYPMALIPAKVTIQRSWFGLFSAHYDVTSFKGYEDLAKWFEIADEEAEKNGKD